MHTYYIAGFPVSDELYHHGIRGQRWGVRRYQNEDGSVTAAGAKRYYEDPEKARQHFDFQKVTSKIKSTAESAKGKISEAYKKREPEREERRKESFASSRNRGKAVYESGYKHSRNILRTAGKVAVKTLGYSVATQTAMSVGGKEVAAIVAAAGAVSIASTVRDSYTNARDYERYRKIRTAL